MRSWGQHPRVILARSEWTLPSARTPRSHWWRTGHWTIALGRGGLQSLLPSNPRFLQPLGSMPLTVYHLHILTAEWMGFPAGFLVSDIAVFAFARKRLFERGPLGDTIKPNLSDRAWPVFEAG